MPNIPSQRGKGQTGNTGTGHLINRGMSIDRGGRPSAGGGGTGNKPPKKRICLLWVIAGFGSLMLAAAQDFYVLYQILG